MRYERLRALREDRDWTQQQVADAIHINRRTYAAYENGVNAMSPQILADLARFFGTSVDYILGLTDVPTPYPPSEPPDFSKKEKSGGFQFIEKLSENSRPQPRTKCNLFFPGTCASEKHISRSVRGFCPLAADKICAKRSASLFRQFQKSGAFAYFHSSRRLPRRGGRASASVTSGRKSGKAAARAAPASPCFPRTVTQSTPPFTEAAYCRLAYPPNAPHIGGQSRLAGSCRCRSQKSSPAWWGR